MNYNEVILHPPGGVTINQWKDGSIHFRCGPDGYMPLAQLLAQIAVQCQTYAEVYKTATQQLTQQQTEAAAPAAQDRIAQLEAEVQRLRGAGIPVSVNTNPVLSAAQQLAAAVVTRVPVTVAPPGPSLLEVAAAMATRGVQHPVAAAAAVAVPMPIIPPANVPPQAPVPPHISSVNTAHQNPGPGIALPPGIIHRPILRQTTVGETIVTGGQEIDDGSFGPPPASI